MNSKYKSMYGSRTNSHYVKLKITEIPQYRNTVNPNAPLTILLRLNSLSIYICVILKT